MSETAPRAMSPHDLTRIQFVSDPQISRDGRRVAFVVTVLPEEKDEYLSNIWIVDGTGGGAPRLTTGPLRDTAPRWSPDGTHLVFVSWVGGWQEPESEDEKQKSKPARVITTLKHKFNAEGFIHDRRPHLFVVPITGCEPRQITDGDCVDADPVWSPAGAWIAFTSARHADRDHDNVSFVWVMQPFG